MYNGHHLANLLVDTSLITERFVAPPFNWSIASYPLLCLDPNQSVFTKIKFMQVNHCKHDLDGKKLKIN